MFQLRRILLSGLVALLMVGMVTANDVSGTDPSFNEAVDGVGFYVGTWNVGHTVCQSGEATNCVKIWASFDVSWLIDLFK